MTISFNSSTNFYYHKASCQASETKPYHFDNQKKQAQVGIVMFVFKNSFSNIKVTVRNSGSLCF